MEVSVYKVECLTNLHVGHGEANYSLIDSEVAKDTVLNMPIIPASGLKGALRAHFGSDFDDDTKIFGSKANEGKDASQKGEYKFFDACLLTRPMRVSAGSVPYLQVTTVAILNHLLGLLHALQVKEINGKKLPKAIKQTLEGKTFSVSRDEVEYVEGFSAKPLNNDHIKEVMDLLLGKDQPYGLCDQETFDFIDLPIVARNKLEKGESQNLWYEEMVPHESVFYFFILLPNEMEEHDREIKAKFDKRLEAEVIQIGGNATIGCGYTKITKVVSV